MRAGFTQGTITGSASGGTTVSGPIVHGQTITVNGAGFGTRPNYNMGGWTWKGQPYLHYLWCDFTEVVPPPGGTGTAATANTDWINWKSAGLNGMYPLFFPSAGGPPAAPRSFALDNAGVVSGGPSFGGKFWQKGPNTGGASDRYGGLYVLISGTPAGVSNSSTGYPGEYISYKYQATGTEPISSGNFKGFRRSYDFTSTRIDGTYPSGAPLELIWTLGNSTDIEAFPGDVWGEPLQTTVGSGAAVAALQNQVNFVTQFNRIQTWTNASGNAQIFCNQNPAIVWQRSGSSVGSVLNMFATNYPTPWGNWSNSTTFDINNLNTGIACTICSESAVNAPYNQNVADIYFDFTPARVEITDGTHSEPQILLNWSNTQIKFLGNQGQLTSGAGTLNVYDNTNTVIQNFPVTIGAPPFDFFISTTGSDANPGTLASPWAITALQSHSATYAGKKLALIAGTYDVSGLNAPLRGSGSSFFNVPLFSVPNGINAANPTYIASCDASGHYSQRAAWLSAKTATPYTTLPNGPQSYTGSYTTFNQVPNEGGLIGNTSATCHDIVIDGLRLSGVRSTPLAFGGGPQGGTSGTTYTNTGIVVKNCEIFDCNDTAFGVAGGNYSAVQFFNCIGAVALNNYIHNLVAFSTSSTASNGHLSLLLFWVCRDHTVTYNTGREAGGFYEKEGGNQGGTYAYNYVEHQVNPGGEGMNNLTGYNSSPLADTTKIYNNVFKMNANGYRLVPNLANGNGQGFSTPLQISNNTMYWTNTSVCGLEMFAMPGTAAVGGFQFYNNIMCGAAQTNEGNFTFNPAAMQTIGFNVWQTLRYVVTSNTTGSAFTGATTATTFAAARTAVGSATFENASVLTAQTIPQLFTQTGTSADQFKLLAGSAALNAGYTNGTGTGGAVCDAGAFSGPNAPPGGLIGSTLNGVKD